MVLEGFEPCVIQILMFLKQLWFLVSSCSYIQIVTPTIISIAWIFFRLRRFESGVLVIQALTHSDEEVIRSTKQIVSKSCLGPGFWLKGALERERSRRAVPLENKTFISRLNCRFLCTLACVPSLLFSGVPTRA